MKLIVTGASGPFGRTATRGLLAKGIAPEDLILVSRDPSRLTELAALGATTRAGDFDIYESLVDAFSGGDKMLMISTNRVGQREPQHANAVNAARAAGVKHIVYTSFVGTAGSPSLAVKDHRFTEDLIKSSGMAWTFLRDSQYSNAMLDAAAPLAITQGVWSCTTGNGRIAFVTRDDCVAAAVAVMATNGHEQKTYDITGPDLLSYPEVCKMISQLSGHPIEFRHVSEGELFSLFDRMGIPRTAKDDHSVEGYGWCSEDMVSFEESVRNGNFAVISDDFENLTGRKPESLYNFLRRHQSQLQRIVPLQ